MRKKLEQWAWNLFLTFAVIFGTLLVLRGINWVIHAVLPSVFRVTEVREKVVIDRAAEALAYDRGVMVGRAEARLENLPEDFGKIAVFSPGVDSLQFQDNNGIIANSVLIFTSDCYPGPYVNDRPIIGVGPGSYNTYLLSNTFFSGTRTTAAEIVQEIIEKRKGMQ